MATLQSFPLDLEREDHLLSFDVKSEYRHFRLAAEMWQYFLFHYDEPFYKCVALPFRWGRSPLWFTELMKPIVRAIGGHGMRILAHLNDFLIEPTRAECIASRLDCRRASNWMEKLPEILGIIRHPIKGEWQGCQRAWNISGWLQTPSR
jgi:hypothetical protein